MYWHCIKTLKNIKKNEKKKKKRKKKEERRGGWPATPRPVWDGRTIPMAGKKNKKN
jgi:hypothetical protein